MIKKIFITVMSSGILLADLCPVPYEIMYGIAKAERHPKRAVGYPYLISINSEDLARRVKEFWGQYFIDERTIDCKDAKTCEFMALQLIAAGINNVDLGPFQINYKWHRFPAKEYFRLDTSYARACGILMKIVKNYGWSWDSVGKYHSYTKKRYKRYSNLVKKFIAEELK